MSKLTETCDALNLTIRAEFIPWSKSRNAREKMPSLNWRVTLVHGTRDVVTIDYSAGMAHCPSYKSWKGSRDSIAARDTFKRECETGKPCHPRDMSHGPFAGRLPTRHPITPSREDVVYCLVSDASAIDCPTFEEWASELGYDTDSRSAETTYRECLRIGLALRAALGDAGLSQLRDACQDY